MDKITFIKKSNKVHNNKYSYKNSIYTKAKNKINIMCFIHGEFSQIAATHLRGSGCMKCGQQRTGDKQRIPVKTFIKILEKVHKNKFCYSNLAALKKIPVFIDITCPKHGIFTQHSAEHKRGVTCPKCATKARGLSIRKGQEAFIQDCIKVHGNLYDYTKIVYERADKKVIIGCKNHGLFTIRAANFLLGSGCQECSTHGFSKEKPGLLYYLKISTNTETAYKIGITNNSVKERYCKTDMKCITILKEVWFMVGAAALKEEQYILNKFKSVKYEGEALLLSGGNTELFTENIIDYFKGSNYVLH